ncbi:DUF2306 domain-containing protein [Pleionea sp. CnH1-48]|uniref:DUF2306 domain-containing protein n=1 Tax=Pleionea sp. CnH1-48 TaxID=2954494 RepID=UPI002096D7CF|nr:DUF2306 domain-containing protein [Pleionea sp. CnH1-48]MCO7222854.1 hypothetical protein [Pleionea sp. CnH1-48]
MIYVHVISGAIALILGTIALSTAKGKISHRKAGKFFSISLLIASASAAYLAYNANDFVYISILAFYLALTSWLTVSKQENTIDYKDISAFLLIVVVAFNLIQSGITAANSPDGRLNDLPAMAYYIFASIATASALLDLRMIVARGIQGKHRIIRHLWRMLFAFIMAVASFLAQDIFPRWIVEAQLLWLPLIFLLLLTIYWITKMLFNRYANPLLLRTKSKPEIQ